MDAADDIEQQASINHNFSYTKFCTCKTVLDAHPCTWEIVQKNRDVHVTNNSMIQQ